MSKNGNSQLGSLFAIGRIALFCGRIFFVFSLAWLSSCGGDVLNRYRNHSKRVKSLCEPEFINLRLSQVLLFWPG